MPTGNYDHPLLGPVTFKTRSSTWVRGDAITFTSGFDPATEVAEVFVPQLEKVRGANHGRFPFHVKGHGQLKAAFSEIERQQLLPYITSFGGGFEPRLRRPTNGSLSKLPSNHAFGLAIDINPDDGSNGGSARPLEPVFTKHGFLWGQVFNDPMHFEIRAFQPFAVWAAYNEQQSSSLSEVIDLIRQQAELFPSGLRHLDLQLSPDGGFRLVLDIGNNTAAFSQGRSIDRQTQLSYERIVELVSANNKCPKVTAELLTALIWKESNFIPDAHSSKPNSSATGLMMITKVALSDVNANTPAGVHFEHVEMTEPEKNIQCGSYYLDLRIKRAGGKVKEGLEGFGTGEGYADDILDCEKCLQGASADPQACLNQIHSRLFEPYCTNAHA